MRAPVSCGWLIIFHPSSVAPSFPLPRFGSIIWDKGQPGLGYHIGYAHEEASVFRCGEPPRPRDALLSVLRVSHDGHDHPTQKPVRLMGHLVKWSVPQGGSLIDPFMGSGTTGVACAKLGRKFIGVEIEPKYFDIACKRIEAAYAQPDLFIEPPAPAEQSDMEL